MKIFDTDLLNELTEQAKMSPRLRMNYNIHKSLESTTQRLLNSLEPGTLLPIHKHHNTSETYVLLRGSLNVHIYSENHELISTTEINQKKGVFGVDILPEQWHILKYLNQGQ
jgi:cupin fold WbuC family metalloprotein